MNSKFWMIFFSRFKSTYDFRWPLLDAFLLYWKILFSSKCLSLSILLWALSVMSRLKIHQIINIKRLWKENLSKLGVIYFQNDNRIMSGSMFGAVAIEKSSSRFHNYRWTFISNQNFVEKYFIIWISRHSRIRLNWHKTNCKACKNYSEW